MYIIGYEAKETLEFKRRNDIIRDPLSLSYLLSVMTSDQ